MAFRSFFFRRRSLLAWSLLAAGLVIFGFALHREVLPQPRCILPIDTAANLSCLSPDGARLVTYGAGVRIWDTFSGRELAVFPELTGHPSDGNVQVGMGSGNDFAAYSKSRRFLAEANQGGRLSLLDVTAQRLRQTPLSGLEVCGQEMQAFESRMGDWRLGPTFRFSPKEDLLAVVIPRGFPPGAHAPANPGSSAMIGSLVGEPTLLAASVLFGGRNDFICHVVETESGRLIGTFDGIANGRRFLQFLEFTPDGRFLLAGMRDALRENAVAVWDTRLARLVRLYEDREPLVLSPDGQKVLTRTRERYAFLDPAGGRSTPAALPAPDPRWLQSFRFSPDGRTLVSHAFAGKPGIDFVDVESGKELVSQEGLSFDHLEFSADSRLFLVRANPPVVVPENGDQKKTPQPGPAYLKVGEVKSRRILWEVRPREFARWWFSADSHVVMELGSEMHVYEGDTGRLQKTIPIDGPSLGRVSHRNPNYVVTREFVAQPELARQPADIINERRGMYRSIIKVVELSAGGQISRLELPGVGGIWLSDDGQTLVTQRREAGRVLFDCWSVPIPDPYRRPLWQVIGVPAAVGVLLVLASWLFPRPRKALSVSPLPTPTDTPQSLPDS